MSKAQGKLDFSVHHPFKIGWMDGWTDIELWMNGWIDRQIG